MTSSATVIGGEGTKMKIENAKCMMYLTFAVALAMLPLERYETIIERMPFGSWPENADSAPAADGDAAGGAMTVQRQTVRQQALAASVRVSALNVTPVGDVKVGFTDSSAKPPASYYLKVGSSRDGWTVKSADPSAESVSLEKGGVEVVVKLGDDMRGVRDAGKICHKSRKGRKAAR